MSDGGRGGGGSPSYDMFWLGGLSRLLLLGFSCVLRAYITGSLWTELTLNFATTTRSSLSYSNEQRSRSRRTTRYERLILLRRTRSRRHGGHPRRALASTSSLASGTAAPGEQGDRSGDRSTSAGSSGDDDRRDQDLALYTPQDNHQLSESICLSRAQLEVFAATADDVDERGVGRGATSRPIAVGQVGIRCIHCARLHHKQRYKGSVSCPKSIRLMNQAVRNWLRYHFDECPVIPASTKERYASVAGRAGNSKKTSSADWVESCERMGLVDVREAGKEEEVGGAGGGGGGGTAGSACSVGANCGADADARTIIRFRSDEDCELATGGSEKSSDEGKLQVAERALDSVIIGDEGETAVTIAGSSGMSLLSAAAEATVATAATVMTTCRRRSPPKTSCGSWKLSDRRISSAQKPTCAALLRVWPVYISVLVLVWKIGTTRTGERSNCVHAAMYAPPAQPPVQPPAQPPAQPPVQSSSANSVTENDLPMMIRYALQNLKSTGHIDGQLDPGVCRMIKQVPEHAALQALEKFSSCDLSVMRNKASYLAGILKRKADEQR